jgi:hypothetical protein
MAVPCRSAQVGATHILVEIHAALLTVSGCRLQCEIEMCRGVWIYVDRIQRPIMSCVRFATLPGAWKRPSSVQAIFRVLWYVGHSLLLVKAH